MSEQSIIEELLAENQLLRQESIEEIIGEDILHTLASFAYEELGEKLKIRGILIAPGIWNNLLYSKEEIKRMYDNYKDLLDTLPIVVEHGRDPEFAYKQVGSHTSTRYNSKLGAIEFEGIVEDPKAVQYIKNGTFGAVSLKSSLLIIKKGELSAGINIKPIDSSLTRAPACNTCRITYVGELSEGMSFYGITLKSQDDNVRSDDNMSDTELSKETEVKEEQYVFVLPKEEEELSDTEVELEVMPLSQALLEKRIIYKYAQPGESKTVTKKYYYEDYPYTYRYPKPKNSDWESMGSIRLSKNTQTGEFALLFETEDGFDVIPLDDLEKALSILRERFTALAKKSDEDEDEKDKEKEDYYYDEKSSLKVEKTGENEWAVIDYSGDQPKVLKTFPSKEDAENWMNNLLKKGEKEQSLSDGEDKTTEDGSDEKSEKVENEGENEGEGQKEGGVTEQKDSGETTKVPDEKGEESQEKGEKESDKESDEGSKNDESVETKEEQKKEKPKEESKTEEKETPETKPDTGSEGVDVDTIIDDIKSNLDLVAELLLRTETKKEW